jgi:hypothetical protein
VRCAIEVSPVNGGDADLDRNLIVVGGSARNSVRARYVQARLPTAILTGEDQVPVKQEQSITIIRGGTESKVNLAEVNVALIEKCRDPDRGTTVFFCLGIRADGSWAATEYLARNWKRLAAEFGDTDFVVCLGFPHTEKYAEDPLPVGRGRQRDHQSAAARADRLPGGNCRWRASPMERDWITFGEARCRQAGSIAAKRSGRPGECGAAQAFLGGVQAGYIYGVNLHLDGGGYVGLV